MFICWWFLSTSLASKSKSLIFEQKPIAATHPRYLLFRFLNNSWILRQLVSGPRQGTGHRLLIVIEVWPSLLAYAVTTSCPAKGVSSESKHEHKLNLISALYASECKTRVILVRNCLRSNPKLRMVSLHISTSI